MNVDSCASFPLDHLFLGENSRNLIYKACAGAKIAYLSPLDKGLSGSSVWLAQWRFHSNQISKFHVFKIGPLHKLRLEREATQRIASVLIRQFPNVELFEDDNLRADPKKRTALLRQEFFGDVEGKAVNLKKFIECSRDDAEVEMVLRKIYENTMEAWHRASSKLGSSHDTSVNLPLNKALDWWTNRMSLSQAAEEIGKTALQRQLTKQFGLTLNGIEARVRRLGQKPERIRIGAVHGDLHAENVLIDGGYNINVIDYGWTALDKWRAIDFLMMECSLKFVVSPPHAEASDLLFLEAVLEEMWTKTKPQRLRQLAGAINGKSLVKIAKAIGYVRRRALACGAVESSAQYRRGLILLTAGLSSLPKLINRLFLFQSICYHLHKIKSK